MKHLSKKPAILKNKANIFSLVYGHKKRFGWEIERRSPLGHYIRGTFLVSGARYEIARQLYVRFFPRVNYIKIENNEERTLTVKEIRVLEHEIEIQMEADSNPRDNATLCVE